MASPLIHKIRSRSPRGFVQAPGKRSLPTNQWSHKYVMYMGRREGVVKHDELNHGLFGKLDHNNGGEFGIIDNIAKAADYVKSKVEDGTYLYDNIISIAREDFERLGYDDKEAWEQLAKDNVVKLADKIGIPASRVEYVAAMHIEGGKPNFHLLFWDKDQGVTNGFIKKPVKVAMWKDLIKYVYGDDIKALGITKTEARDAILEEADTWNKDTFNSFNKMTKADFKATKNNVLSDPDEMLGKIFNRNVPNAVLDDLRIKIIQLMDKLPDSGRLAYGFLTPDLKKEITELTEDIIKELSTTNPDFKAEFETYKKSARDLAALYTTNTDAHDKAEERAEADLTKRMANRLLKCIKSIDYEQYKFGKEEFTKRKNITMQRNATMRLLSMLFQGARKENRQAKNPRLGRGDLSKEAKRELRKELEHGTGNQWGGGWEQ